MEQSKKELQSIVWSEVSEKPNREGEFDLSNNAIEEAVMADKIALLRIIDGMILSIYKRAMRESAKYFSEYKKFLGTEFTTNLRPRIRYRPEGHTCDLSWVKVTVKVSPATAEDITKYGIGKFSSVRGQGKRIVKKHGQQVTQTIKYIYIKKSTDFSYRPGIFLHQPGWVQREGTHLEQCFTLLRQQLKELSDLRRRILVRMFLLDKKFFDNSRLSEPNRPDLGKPKEYDTMMAAVPEDDDEMENETDNSKEKTE